MGNINKAKETLFVIISAIVIIFYSYIMCLCCLEITKWLCAKANIEYVYDSQRLTTVWGIIMVVTGLIWSKVCIRGTRKINVPEDAIIDDKQLNKMIELDKERRFLDIVKGRHFTVGQIREISKGLDSGIDVSCYTDEAFTSEQMSEIRKGLEIDIDVSCYCKIDYKAEQMRIIREGLIMGLDVSLYSNPKFNVYQMYQIQKGIMQGIDVSVYANTDISWEEMEAKRIKLNPSNI